ncbi:hypothetical protein [Arthrobacter sp. NPDC058127]|uniref:hypothetical protein n=1 Tax=Arthrobacter sp. NPDC058127 TaxID=3346351 RepID=UPI0036E16AE7
MKASLGNDLVLILSPQDNGNETRLRFCDLLCGDHLRAALAQRVLDLCSPFGTWNSPETAKTAFYMLGRFLKTGYFRELSDIKPNNWKEFWLSLKPSMKVYAGSLRILLLGAEGLPPETVESMLALSGHTIPTGKPAASLNDADVESLRDKTWATLVAARDRIRAGWRLVQRFKSGMSASDPDYSYAAILTEIATQGDIQRRSSSRNQRYLPPDVLRRLYGGTRGQTTAMPLFEQLYLTSQEGAAALIALGITCGWNLSVAISLQSTEVRRIDARDESEPEILGVRLRKPRRGAADTWSENYQDTGPRSKARLLQVLLECTEGARRTLKELGKPRHELLIVLPAHLVGVTQTETPSPLFPLSTVGYRAVLQHLSTWRENNPEYGSAGPRAVRQYFTSRVHPQGHKASTNSSYVLRDPVVRESSKSTIEDGIASAIAFLQATVIDANVVSAENAPIAAAAGTLLDVNEKRNDTVIGACQNPKESGITGGPCTASLLLCFACRNAIVMSRHLPRIVLLFNRIDAIRSVTEEEDWAVNWSAHHSRLIDLLEPGKFFSESQIKSAPDAVTSEDIRMIERLLAREWDVA